MESGWPETEESFRTYLLTHGRRHGRSLTTAKTYLRNVRYFADWCWTRKLSPRSASEEDVALYFALLRQHRDTNTVPLRLSAVRAFYGFCRKKGWRPDDPTEDISVPWQDLLPRPPLPDNELRLLLGACRSDRDRTMVSVGYDCGLRVGEVIGMNDRDIDFQGGVIRVHGKGRRDRIVMPSTCTMEMLKAFVGQPDGILWWKKDGKPMEVKRAQRNMENIAKRAGVRAHWHRLRTTFANTAFKEEIRIEIVQEMMGHSQISTTRQYMGWSIKSQAMESMRALHAMERLLT